MVAEISGSIGSIGVDSDITAAVHEAFCKRISRHLAERFSTYLTIFNLLHCFAGRPPYQQLGRFGAIVQVVWSWRLLLCLRPRSWKESSSFKLPIRGFDMSDLVGFTKYWCSASENFAAVSR